jgi:hypothetical protein
VGPPFWLLVGGAAIQAAPVWLAVFALRLWLAPQRSTTGTVQEGRHSPTQNSSAWVTYPMCSNLTTLKPCFDRRPQLLPGLRVLLRRGTSCTAAPTCPTVPPRGARGGGPVCVDVNEGAFTNTKTTSGTSGFQRCRLPTPARLLNGLLSSSVLQQPAAHEPYGRMLVCSGAVFGPHTLIPAHTPFALRRTPRLSPT